MKRFWVYLAIIVFVFSSCQKLPEFTQLKVIDQAYVSVVRGLKRTVTADDKSYVINNGVLTISGQAHVVITLTDQDLGNLNYIEVDSTADFFLDTSQTFELADNFVLRVGGEANAVMGGNYSNLAIYLSDEADVSFYNSTAKTVALSATDLVDFYAYGLQAENYDLSVSGSTYAEIMATKAITGSVSDQATVYYKGNPTDINVQVTGDATFEPDTLK